MTFSWRVEAWVKDLGHFTLTDADTTTQPGPGEVVLVAPFTMNETTDGVLWPAQPRESARLTFLANTAAELASPDRGTPVCIGFKSPSTAAGVGNSWDWRMVGLVDSWTLRPLSGGPGALQGVLAEVTVIDCRVGKLSTLDAGTADRALEVTSTRLQSALGAFNTSGPTPWESSNDPNRTARTGSRTSALEFAERLLSTWVDQDASGQEVGRPYLTPQTTGSAYDIEDVEQVINGVNDLPVWYLIRQDKTPSLSDQIDIAGDLVGLDAVSWRKVGEEVPTLVSVQYDDPQATTEDWNGDYQTRPVAVNIETDLNNLVAANRVVDLYLPNSGTSEWLTDTFRYYMSSGPDAPVLPRVGILVNVTDIDTAVTPDGLSTYSGLVTTIDLSVESDQVVADLTTLPVTGAQSLDGGDATTTTWVLDLDGGDATTTFAPTYDGGMA